MTKKKRTRIIVIASAAFVVIVGGVIGITAFAKSGSSDSTTTFRTAQATTGNVEITVTGSGTISDSTEYSLTAVNAGTIDSLPVKQGDTVKAGQTIAHVSDTNSAQTILQKQNALTSAKNALTQSEQSLNNLTIKAPVAGKVKSVIASAGDDLSTIKSLGNLAVISTERAMTVSVSSTASLKIGDTVKVTDTAAKKTYTGTVTSSGSSGGAGQGGQSSSGGVTVTIASDDPQVGDTATIATSAGVTAGSGTFALVKYIPISSNGSGIISNVYVSENQMVSKNTALFKLNSDSVESDIQMKQSAVTSAQKDLADAQTAAAKDTITSPIDGIIAELAVKNGSSVASNGTVATIINKSAMETVVSVDELDIAKVQVGQKANITLDAISGKTFTGSVVQVDPIGTASNGVTNYSVTVTVNNPEGIMIGMNTNVSIITQSKENVVTLPASAILNKRGTTAYVLSSDGLFDSNGKSIQMNNVNSMELLQKYGKQITIGLANTDTVEVVSGLSAGDKVAVATTVSKSAIASLNNSQSATNNFSAFGGGMGGMGGMTGGTGGYSTRTKTRTGTGNTVSGSNNAGTGTTGGNTANGNTAGGTAGGTTGGTGGGTGTTDRTFNGGTGGNG